MKILRARSSPRYERTDGITSYLLASQRTAHARQLTATLVEIRPGGKQRIHAHDPEQLYYILEGTGRMTVGEETARVEPGDCVLVPSGEPHGLHNDGADQLRYFSAAAPAFTEDELHSLWPLPAEDAE